MKIKLFKDFINESGIGGINVAGVNFGSDRGDVGSSNFGDKGDSSFDQRGAMNPVDIVMTFSEYTGGYYSETDIRDIIFKYDIWCKQNNESPIEITNMGTKTLDFILKKIGDV